MKYAPRVNFDWVNATQDQLNEYVSKISRQQVYVTIRKHYELKNYELVERIEKAQELHKAREKARKAKEKAEKALEALGVVEKI
jgi:hypothetical protein